MQIQAISSCGCVRNLELKKIEEAIESRAIVEIANRTAQINVKTFAVWEVAKYKLSHFCSIVNDSSAAVAMRKSPGMDSLLCNIDIFSIIINYLRII